jgi:hypothetical protein
MQALPAVERLLRRGGLVLFWGLVLLLGAFGAYFSFANYPSFGSGVVLAILLLIAYRERQRRARRRASERARRRVRVRRTDP